MFQKFLRIPTFLLGSLSLFLSIATPAKANEALLLEITYQLEELHQNVASLKGSIEELQNDVQQVKSSQDSQYLEFDDRINEFQATLNGTEQLALQTQEVLQTLESQTIIQNEKIAVIEQAIQNSLPQDSTTVSIISTDTISQIESATSSLIANEAKQAQLDYQKAKQHALNDEYDLARTGFTKLAEQFPKTKYAGFAYYWLGQVELAYDAPNLKSAQKAFQTVVDSYPKSKRLPETLLRLAEVELALSRPSTANTLLEKLITEFPKSRHTAEAKALQVTMAGHNFASEFSHSAAGSSSDVETGSSTAQNQE